jgi:hypothetical protein
MAAKFVDRLQTRITNVGGIGAADGSVGITPGDGAKILADVPSINNGQDFILAWFKDAAANRECVKITGVSTDTCTLGQRGVNPRFPARAWAQGDILHFSLCKSSFDGIGKCEYGAKTADYIITADELMIAKTFTNYGASAEVNLSLPAGAAGYRGRIIVAVAQYLRLTANGSARFRMGSSIGVAGGFVRSNTIGTMFDFEYVPGLDQWLLSPHTVPLLADE